MKDTDVEIRPHMQGRLAAVKARGNDGKFGDSDLAPPSLWLPMKRLRKPPTATRNTAQVLVGGRDSNAKIGGNNR
jgi:hypothetical protein